MATCTEWYKILRLKKTEVVEQLTARQIAFKLATHHMTLKSMLYKATKTVQDLLSQFKAIIGNDWKTAYKESGKSFKKFQKDLLIKFHPDKHNGCKQASEISKTITGWTEPVVVTQELIDELYQQRYDQWTRKSDHTIDPLSDKYYMMREVQELLAHMGLTYDFTNEAWYKEYQAEVEKRRNDDIFLQYI